MDFDGGFASLPFRSPQEAAASVGRGPDPAGTAGGRGSPAAGDRARRGHASSTLLARTPPRRAGMCPAPSPRAAPGPGGSGDARPHPRGRGQRWPRPPRAGVVPESGETEPGSEPGSVRTAGGAAALLLPSSRSEVPAADSSELGKAEVPLPLGTLRKGGATDSSGSDAEWEGERRGWFSPSAVPAVGRREAAVFAGRGDVRVCQPLLCHEHLSRLPH